MASSTWACSQLISRPPVSSCTNRTDAGRGQRVHCSRPAGQGTQADQTLVRERRQIGADPLSFPCAWTCHASRGEPVRVLTALPTRAVRCALLGGCSPVQ